MDFLVVGLGLGALAILSGIVMVTFLAWHSERAVRRAARPEEQRYYMASVASRNAAGQALIATGTVILLATVGAVAGSLDDRTGSLLVATTATVAAIGLVVRDFLYRSRNPMPRWPRAQPLETPVAESATRTAPLAAPLAAPVAVASHDDSQEEETELDEAVAALVEEPAPVAIAQESVPAPDDVEDSIAVAEPESSAEEVDADPVGVEEGAVIDVPYSFMRDEDPAAGTRSAPYSFMNADDPEHESGETGATNGDQSDPDQAAAILAAKPMNDPPDREKTGKARPALRLVGKGRSQAP